MSDWKEIEDHNEPCSPSNGWCGMCGNCCDHAEDLRNQEEWEENDFPSY